MLAPATTEPVAATPDPLSETIIAASVTFGATCLKELIINAPIDPAPQRSLPAVKPLLTSETNAPVVNDPEVVPWAKIKGFLAAGVIFCREDTKLNVDTGYAPAIII